MIPSTSDIETARTLLAFRARCAPNHVAGFARPVDFAAAYRIQAAMEHILVSERGFEPTGYKIAGTNEAARRLANIPSPFFGRLYRQSTSLGPTALPARPGLWRVHEAEIGFLLGRDLGPAGAPYEAASVAAATEAVLPAIEIVATSFAPWTEAGGFNLVSDNAAHGYWIMGEAVTDFASLDLLDSPITLSINGQLRATGKGRNVEGGPLGMTAWLANMLLGMGRMLKAGDYVTTGTTILPQPVGTNESALADFGPLGRIVYRIGE
jgi:2-keto-4-pentenoate hydratase